MAELVDWKNATAFPGMLLEAFLVPEISAAQKKANLKTFYWGINQWSLQWQDARSDSRKRNEVPAVPIDSAHHIATLQSCITGTVSAYQTAASDLSALKASNTDKASPEFVIYQGLGHGALTKDLDHLAVADFGSQLDKFDQHEFRVSLNTFEVYRRIRVDGFAAEIPWKKGMMSDKQKAQELLCFDGLSAIRNAIKSVVKRIRIVTCNIGDDSDLIDQLTWVLGNPRKGELPDTKIVIEAYNRPVDCRQWDNEETKFDERPVYRMVLLEDPNVPANTRKAPKPPPDSDKELPNKHLVRGDPTKLKPVPVTKGDPLPTSPTNIAVSLGECESISNLIPADVLTQ